MRELVIKRQHNCRTTGFWYTNSIKYNFLLLAHEYLPIFEKPKLHDLSVVREKVANYGLNIPNMEEPPRETSWKHVLLKERLEKLETTTVWILPEKDFEESLSKNVVDRYSNGEEYSIISIGPHPEDNANCGNIGKQNGKGLVFIKTAFLSENSSHSNIESYLHKTKEIIDCELSAINNGGFIVIRTQDVRIDGYIEPMAKRVIDMLLPNSLWLKEIIVATPENSNSKTQISKDYLKIAHQYLLVYEVKR